MKAFLVSLGLMGFAGTAFANFITCDVTSPKTYSAVIFDLDMRSVNTIDIQSGGHTQRIYARWPLIRGAFTFASCSPNINEYKENMSAFLVNARCSGGGLSMNASFYASLDPKTGGDLAFVKADKDYESVSFSNCK